MSEPAFLYHEILPENNKASYGAHENVDFNLTFQGRAMNLGSVRIEGELEVKYAGRFLNSDDNVGGVIKDKSIYLNPAVGAHSCFESITTSVQGVVVETAMDYNRWVNLATRATSEQGDFGNQSDQTCELKASYFQHTLPLLQGNEPDKQPTVPIRLNPDFSVKPMIALNSSVRAMPYSKSGVIRLTLNMARVNQILWGKDMDGQVTYSCKDLRVTFTSIPEEDADMKTPIRLRTKIAMKQSIQSQLSNVALRVPGICTGVSCCFLPQTQENSQKADALQIVTVPNMNSVQFAFNDATSQLISFKLKSNTEIIGNFIKSMVDTGLSTLTPTQWANNEGYGVGVSFNGQAVDLRNQKFSVQTNATGVNAATPYVIFLYFHSFVDM